MFIVCVGVKLKNSRQELWLKLCLENLQGNLCCFWRCLEHLMIMPALKSFDRYGRLRAGGFRRVMLGCELYLVDKPEADAKVFDKMKSAFDGKQKLFIVVDRRRVEKKNQRPWWLL